MTSFLSAQNIFIGPLPGVLLILFKPSAVLFYNVSFAIPSIIFSTVIVPIWATQKQDSACQRIRVIQRYTILGHFPGWIPWILLEELYREEFRCFHIFVMVYR